MDEMTQGKEKYILDGFQFSGKIEFERARKEKETIAYLTANTDLTDMKAVLKIYNRSVEKKSFQTVIGLQFLSNIRQRLIGSQIVSENTLAPVAISEGGGTPYLGGQRRKPELNDVEKAEVQRYKSLYETAVANQKIKNVVIVVLAVVILGMFIITLTSKYTVLTYFTDYKTNIRNEVVDELEDWQQELEKREAELNEGKAGQDE